MHKLPPKVADAFVMLGNTQNGAAGLHLALAKVSMGGGVFASFLQDASMLLVPMTASAAFGFPGYDEVYAAVKKLIRVLDGRAALQRAMQQNFSAQAAFFGKSVVEFMATLNPILADLAAAQRTLVVYNMAQLLAREIAVAAAETDFDLCQMYLQQLNEYLYSPECFREEAFDHTVDSDGIPIPIAKTN